MKTIELKHRILFLFLFVSAFVYGQLGMGSIKGKLTDLASGEPLPFTNVVAKQGDQILGISVTDFNGYYFIKPLKPGNYDLECSFSGYDSCRIIGVTVKPERIIFLDIKLQTGTGRQADIIYTLPYISCDRSITRDDIAKMPKRSGTMCQTTCHLRSSDENPTLRAARVPGKYIYIDGIKVRGTRNLPNISISVIQFISNGLPANYESADDTTSSEDE